MKQLFAYLLAGVMILALVACHKGEIESGPKNTDHMAADSSDTVTKVNMTYGTDEIRITLYKPDNASFTLGSENSQDAGDLVGLIADDSSWDAEVMGYISYNIDIPSNEPFADYYYLSKLRSEDYTSYEQTVTDMRMDYEGKPVKLIRYTYQEADDEEVCSACFIGFEFTDTSGGEDNGKGLMGLKVTSEDGELPDSELAGLFCEMFYPER